MSGVSHFEEVDSAVPAGTEVPQVESNGLGVRVPQSAAAVSLAADPVLTRYEPSSMTLSGEGFLPNRQVLISLSVYGNYVTNSQGVQIFDSRMAGTVTTSDSGGYINAHVDPKTVLPALDLGDGFILYGVLGGEVMTFKAHDDRQRYTPDFKVTA